EVLVRPHEALRVHHGRSPVHALRLPARGRVGTVSLAVQPVFVPRARRDVGDGQGEDVVRAPGHWLGAPALDRHVHRPAPGRPDGEGDRIFTNACAQHVHTLQLTTYGLGLRPGLAHPPPDGA